MLSQFNSSNGENDMTMSEVCARFDAKMVRKIVRTVGKESLADVARYGASGGVSGFTYYSDTVAFFKK